MVLRTMRGQPIRALVVGVLALAAGCVVAQKAGSFEPGFVDVTASTGIKFAHLSSPDQRYIVESMSGGVVLFDYDGDGWLDIYFTNAPSVSMAMAGKKARGALYRNNHDGTFTDTTDKAGIATPCWAMGAAVADVTNSGRQDLLVSCFGGVVLYRNNGDGTFTDVTAKAGLAQDSGWATGVTFGDYDGDGFPDFFVPHYVDFHLDDLPKFGSAKTCQYHEVAVQCGPRGLKGSGDALYHNNGDGTFTEVAAQAGVDDKQHYFGLGAVWTDFDNDGKLDLFVANDGESNYLYRNQGDGTFKEVGADAGVAFSEDGVEQANMGLAVGDFENKGRMSVAISHFSDEYMTLYRNDGAMNFTDVSHSAGVARATVPYVGWGDAFLDLDNSGWLDLMLVNGHVYPQVDSAKLGIHYREPAVLFRNQHNGKFEEAKMGAGDPLAVPQVSRGLAVGDLFNRGALDVVIENLVGEPEVLSSRPNPAHHWVSVELEGAPKNRMALNARVHVSSGGVTQMGEVRSGGSYLSQSDLRLHFGLGGAKEIETMVVEWPGATPQTFHHVAADGFYHLKQGGELIRGNASTRK
jgi:hypothetical protein